MTNSSIYVLTLDRVNREKICSETATRSSVESNLKTLTSSRVMVEMCVVQVGRNPRRCSIRVGVTIRVTLKMHNKLRLGTGRIILLQGRTEAVTAGNTSMTVVFSVWNASVPSLEKRTVTETEASPAASSGGVREMRPRIPAPGSMAAESSPRFATSKPLSREISRFVSRSRR